MNLRHAAALALILLMGCGSDMAAIDGATQRAKASARRAESAALEAEHASEIAKQAAIRMQQQAVSAQWSAIKAIDVEQRLCAVAARVWTKDWPPPEYFEYLKRQREACSVN